MPGRDWSGGAPSAVGVEGRGRSVADEPEVAVRLVSVGPDQHAQGAGRTCGSSLASSSSSVVIWDRLKMVFP